MRASLKRAAAFIAETIAKGSRFRRLGRGIPAPVNTPTIEVKLVEGARGDLFDLNGELVARDVEIAPYVKITFTERDR